MFGGLTNFLVEPSMANFGKLPKPPLPAEPDPRGLEGKGRHGFQLICSTPLTYHHTAKIGKGGSKAKGGKLKRRDVFRRQKTVLTMIVHSSG